MKTPEKVTSITALHKLSEVGKIFQSKTLSFKISKKTQSFNGFRFLLKMSNDNVSRSIIDFPL